MIDMNVETAWAIVENQNPGMRPFTCLETKKHYCFSLIPDDLDAGDAFANGAVYMVSKNSGDYKVVPWDISAKEPVVQIIDVSRFH